MKAVEVNQFHVTVTTESDGIIDNHQIYNVMEIYIIGLKIESKSLPNIERIDEQMSEIIYSV